MKLTLDQFLELTRELADLIIQSPDRAVARRVTGKWVVEYPLVRVGPHWEIEALARIPW